MSARLVSCAIAGALLAPGRPAAFDDTPSVRELVASATAYVAQYQQQLTSVVADEEYTQEILEQTPRDPNMPLVRRLRSEVFFVFEPVDRQWMAIRDTILVDGRPLPYRSGARLAFESLPPAEVRQRFSRLNSQWNLGRIFRTFNEPTLALLPFDREHVSRFKFDRRTVTQTPDGMLATVAFRERERPTLIQDLALGSVFSEGEVVIDAAGAVRRTAFRLSTKEKKIELTTEYVKHETLGMWVPSVFRERYETNRNRGNEHERIAAEALYSNYKRFEVLTRVK